MSGVLQFNRKVEYALAIVGYLAEADRGALHSARSVAEATHIPFDMVTKCLQRLHRQGLCAAIQGKHGGYRLEADLAAVSIGEFLDQVFHRLAETAPVPRRQADQAWSIPALEIMHQAPVRCSTSTAASSTCCTRSAWPSSSITARRPEPTLREETIARTEPALPRRRPPERPARAYPPREGARR